MLSIPSRPSVILVETANGRLPGAAGSTEEGTTMEYVLLIYGAEKVWAAADDAVRAEVFAGHAEFARLLGEHGHTIKAGAELQPTSAARTLRGTPDSVDVTDGPFAETAEQLGGFYLVETDDIDHVIKLAGLISYGEPIEVRPTTSGEAGAS